MTLMALILFSGLIGGVIDSIIGGGGLISLPVLMLSLGINPTAIGTNKMAGACCTLTAVVMYSWNRQMRWRTAIRFGIWVGLGSVLGAAVSPRYLRPLYPWLLVLGTLLCVATMLLREYLMSLYSSRREPSRVALSLGACLLGVLCGFYDGAWGPGGGTFMFLALWYATPLGLMGSIAASKTANFFSSSLSLVAYSLQGCVQWREGMLMAASLSVGAVLGAQIAMRHAERVLMPLLFVISALLLWKLWGVIW